MAIKRRQLLLLGILFSAFAVEAQTVSSGGGTGNWNDPASWTPNVVPTNVNTTSVTIVAGHTITVTDSRSIDQLTVDGNLIINNGFVLTIADGGGTDLTVNGELSVFGTLTIFIDPPPPPVFNATVNVNGILRNSGTINNSAATRLFMNAGSEYIHEYTTTGGSIPIAAWNLTSTCTIAGYTTNTTPPTGLNQTFGNFTWDTPNQDASSFVNLDGALTQVNGNLTIVNSPGYCGFTQATPFTLNVGGNLVLGSEYVFSDAASATINVTGNTDFAGGFNYLTGAGNIILNLSGDLTFSGGTHDFSYGIGTTTINLSGDLNLNGGDLIETASVNQVINFSSTSTQIVSGSSTTISNNIGYVVNNGATLDLGATSLYGGGTFTLQSGGTIIVDSPDGLTTGNTLGNIRVTGTRIYQATGNIIYGGVTQNLGNEWGSTGALNGIGVNLELINGTVVTNNNIGTTGIVGILSLTNGRLNIGSSNTLNIQGIFNSTSSGTIGGSTTSNLSFGGSGAMGVLNMASGAESINILTVGRSGNLVLGTNLTIEGSINLSFGNLDFSGRTLTMNGSSITSSGTGMISSNTSNLVFGGSTYSGSVPFQGANQLNNLTFSTPGGTFNWGSNVTINGSVTLTAGSVTHTSGLTMGTNSTFFKGAGSISGSSPDAVTSYNVTYTASGNTGVELPTLSTALNNLTVTSGTVNLVTTGITINGNALFSSGDFLAGSNTLFMNGPTWSTSGGSFTPGTGTVVITGNTSIQGTSTPQFYDLTASSTSTLTARAGVIDIINNLQVDAASTFNHNSGTFNFTGGALQGIAGGGKSFYDITVNKTGGNLQLTSALNLINSLSVVSPTTFESAGHLVLVSTSDGASGNARIGQLLGGANITGDVTSQRFMSEEGRIYRYISSPLTNASVAQLQDDFPITGTFTGASTGCTGCTTNTSMYYYDESLAGTIQDGYFQYPVATNTEALQPGRGYVPFVRDDIIAGNVTIDLTGPINQGSVVLPVTYNNTGDITADGYNLVGNPFPSSIDWDNVSGWTKTNISATIAVRDNGAGGVFHYWDGATGSFNNGQIATGQGFWARATAASPSLIANEQAKTTSTGIFYRTDEEEEEIDVLELILTNGTLTDNAYLRLRTKASNLLDEFDGPKLDNASFDMYTIADDGLPMAINALKTVACDQPIKLAIKDMPKGSFSISRKALGAFEKYNVALHDKFTNTTAVLGAADKYDFAVGDDALSKAEDRFTITLSITEPADVEYVDEILYSNYNSGNQWYRNGIAIEGATEPTYTPDLSGEYSLVVTVGTCQSAAARTFQITGVEEEDLTRVKIFPNPIKDNLQVEVRATSPVSVDLLDVMGRSVETIGVSEVSSGLWVGSTNLAKFEKGVYIVRVFDSVNGLYHRRIIKE